MSESYADGELAYRGCCNTPVFDKHRPECEIGQAAAELAAREWHPRTVHELRLEVENERLRARLAKLEAQLGAELEAEDLRYQLLQNHLDMVAPRPAEAVA